MGLLGWQPTASLFASVSYTCLSRVFGCLSFTWLCPPNTLNYARKDAMNNGNGAPGTRCKSRNKGFRMEVIIWRHLCCTSQEENRTWQKIFLLMEKNIKMKVSACGWSVVDASAFCRQQMPWVGYSLLYSHSRSLQTAAWKAGGMAEISTFFNLKAMEYKHTQADAFLPMERWTEKEKTNNHSLSISKKWKGEPIPSNFSVVLLILLFVLRL